MTEKKTIKLTEEEKRIVEFLNRSRLFTHIDTHDLVDIVPICRFAKMNNGDLVFQDNDPGRNIYIIVEGKVEIVLETILPNLEIKFSVLESGDTFGEISFVDDKPRSATARCLSDSKFIIINGLKMREHIESRPAIGSIFYQNAAKLLAERVRKMNHKMLSVMRGTQMSQNNSKDQTNNEQES
jgi:CRP-like cAMP-binding protein